MSLELRAQTTLVCGAMALALAAATLLRGKMKGVDVVFALFAAALGGLWFSQSIYGFSGSKLFERAAEGFAALVPIVALQLFEALVPRDGGEARSGSVPPRARSKLLVFVRVATLPMLGLVVSPAWERREVRAVLCVYLFALLLVGFLTLRQRASGSRSSATEPRVRLLAVAAVAAALAAAIDLVWFLFVALPPVGAVLSVVFLFVLSYALSQERMLDVSEMLGRLLVATALAFVIAGVFWALIAVSGGFGQVYLSVVVAAIVVLLLYDPLRQRAERLFQRLFFRERFALETAVAAARVKLVHTLELGEMGALVMDALERSRRVTAAGLWVRDPEGSGFDRLASLGPKVPERVEIASARALLDRLAKGPVVLEEEQREDRDRKARGEAPDPAQTAVLTAAEVLGPLHLGVVIGLKDDAGEVVGLLCAHDERVVDSLSPDEIALLDALASQLALVVENTRVYAQLKERDRLAVLGMMAAGLAHEIRNPLGAIKGAAQLLADEPERGGEQAPGGEFIDIILEEVDRLNRVVSSVLDLSRPNAPQVHTCDVNAVVRRTMQLVAAERGTEEVQVDLILDDSLPRAAMDAEALRQVIINLHRNAAQAMKGKGRFAITTRVRFGRGTRSGTMGGAKVASGVQPKEGETYVELTVADSGPGMSRAMLEKLFLPFFTTKEKGTGLGLAVSQRLVQAAGGRVEVRSYEGKGSQFTLILPTARLGAEGSPGPPSVRTRPA